MPPMINNTPNNFTKLRELPKIKTEKKTISKTLLFLITPAKPGFGAFITAVKSAQLPITEKKLAIVIITKKTGNCSDSQILLSAPIFMVTNPRKANPKRKSNICFEEKPLFPKYLVHKTIPTNDNEAKIEYIYHGIFLFYQNSPKGQFFIYSAYGTMNRSKQKDLAVFNNRKVTS